MVIELPPPRPRVPARAVVLAALVALLLPLAVPRQAGAQNPASTQPGLALTFETRPAPRTPPTPPARDARVSRLLALRVADGSPPTPFLPAGPFRATWEGFLEIEFLDDYTFRLEGNGEASLEIDGKSIVPKAALILENAPDTTVELDEGWRRVVLRYESPTRGDAVLLAKWSSFDFATEPIPPTLLRHDPSLAFLSERARVRDGRALFASRGCARCHALDSTITGGMPELAERAADFAGTGSRLRASWLARWIDHPRAERAEATMPRLFGDGHGAALDPRSADVAAYLSSLVDPDLPRNELAGASSERGREIFAEVGCLGCHIGFDQNADDGDENDENHGNDDRVSLAHVAAKWKPAALAAFLQEPSRNSASIRMPDLALSGDETRDLAAYLLEATRPDPAAPGSASKQETRGDPERGRQLFESSGCRSCHEPDAEDGLHAPPLRTVLASDLRTGCLADNAGVRAQAPDFELTETERLALRAFLREGTGSLARVDPVEYTRRQFRTLRCEACHRRDGRLDTWSRVTSGDGAADGLTADEFAAAAAIAGSAANRTPENAELLQIRPPLTWTGEKARPEWLTRFLEDPSLEKVRPWLRARMPRFAADTRVLARGIIAEHGFPAAASPLKDLRPELARTGERLVKEDGGLTCEKCHDRGDQQATSAFDAKGPDLLRAPSRLRQEFYLRWLLDPQRIEPGSKMPQFATDGVSAVSDILDGDAQRQFEAIWEYMKTGARTAGP